MKTRVSLRIYLAGLALLVPALLSFSLFAGNANQMFSTSGEEPQYKHTLFAGQGPESRTASTSLEFFEQHEEIIRYRKVALDQGVTSKSHVQRNDSMYLNLFDDASHVAGIERAYENVNGTWSVTGRLAGEGYLILVTTGDRSLGSIYVPSENLFYKIISDPHTRQHYLIEMDARDRDILESAPPLIPDEDMRNTEEQKRIKKDVGMRDAGPDDYATINVMVVYTPSAESWGNSSGGGIDNVVAASMANAQLVLDNSEVKMTMSLVHSRMIDYQESGSAGNILRRFTASPDFNPFGGEFGGYMEEVHNWRDEYSADLSALFLTMSDAGGIAWLLNDRFGNPDMGFSLTRVQQAATGYTHIHEMGHNMGLHHHADQNFQPGPTQWGNWPENHWSAGWRWIGEDGQYYVSVMSYTAGQYYADGNNSTQVPYFSNPQVTYQGVPTGNWSSGNNALTLLEIKHVIAAYRSDALAEVFTEDVTDITALSAISGGNITQDGGSEITQRGVVWSRDGIPTLEDHEGMTVDGQGTGAFVSQLDSLYPSSDYFVRAYAINQSGTRYAALKDFRTSAAFRPSIETTEATVVTHNSALAGGIITSDGNVPVLERGVVWSTLPNVNLTLNNEGQTSDGTLIGEYTSELTGLDPETTYYYRSYATNIMGTNYGNEYELTTLAARLYPNPVADRLWVEFTNDSDREVVIKIHNLQGQLVKKRTIYDSGEIQASFNTSQLRGGLYTLSIYGDYDFPSFMVNVTPDR